MIAATANVKYVFMDIVKYAQGRNIEAQCDIIKTLNEITVDAVASVNLLEPPIYLPTGDGICIAITDSLAPFDIHLTIAVSILNALAERNQQQSSAARKFTLRIGINENLDNIVVDINGRRNVAGVGINVAQRVMAVGDDNMIMVASPAWERLSHREKYEELFRRYITQDKHGQEVRVYQFVDNAIDALNIEVPEKFRPAAKPAERLTLYDAHYLSLVISNSDYIRKHLDAFNTYTLIVLFGLLAEDGISAASSKGVDQPIVMISDKPRDKVIAEIRTSNIWVLMVASRHVESQLSAIGHRQLIGFSRLSVKDSTVELIRAQQADVAALYFT